MQGRDLLLIDGNSLINRAYYGGTELNLADGTPIGAVYTFFNIVLRYAKELHITHLAVAFDLPEPTFRHKLFHSYKSGRKPMSDDLATQFTFLKMILPELGWACYSLAGYEADDILGTLAKQSCSEMEHVYILSGDRDTLQLVDSNISVIYPGRHSAVTFYTPASLQEDFGCTPKSFITYKALLGDTSDAVPGVPGIGKVSASKIVGQFSSLDEIYENLSAFSPKVQAKLVEGRNTAYQALALVTINCAIPLKWALADLSLAGSHDKWREVIKKYSFNSLLEKMNVLYSAAQVETDKKETALADSDTIADEKIGATEKNPLPNESGTQETSTPALYRFINTDEWRTWLENASPILIMAERYPSIYIADPEQHVYICIDQTIFPDFYAWSELSGKKILCFSLKQILQRFPALLSENNCVDYTTGTIIDLSILAYACGDAQKVAYLSDLAELYRLNYPISSENTGMKELPENNCSISSAEAEAQAQAVAVADLNKELISYFNTIIAVYSLVKSKIESQGLNYLVSQVDLPLVEVLTQMERDGVAVDEAVLQRQTEAFSSEIADIADEIYKLAGHEFNLNSPRQLAEVLFNELGLPGGKKLKSGYSTSAEDLMHLQDLHPIVDLILRYRMLSKLLSTFIVGLHKYIAADHRIHTTFHQTLTQTGRLSSSDPNLQNIPARTEEGRRIRAAFIAAPGCILIDADYSQIELRLLAHLSGDTAMLKAFAAKEDIHALTAARVFHMDPVDVTSEHRRVGKTINFSIVYGISAFSLAQDLHISVAEAKNYIAEYYATYPQIKAYLNDLVERAKIDGYVETMFKRRRYIPELKSKNYNRRLFGERVAMNTPIQGTAADIMRLAMVNLARKLREKKLKSHMILQIHDELVLEVPEPEFAEVAELLRNEMERVIDLKVSLPVDLEYGKNWLEAKG